jgi:hypothetical protein
MTEQTFNPLDYTKPKVYTLYLGIVVNDEEDPEKPPKYEDIGEHRTINVMAGSMEDLTGKLEKILAPGEYFMGAVLLAVLEHSFSDRVKFLNEV